MTSTPKPNRAPTRHAEDLTDEEFGHLMTLEEAVWYLRNNKAPVIEIGKAAHALKTSGLWKRPYYNDDPNWPEARTTYTWEDYCRLHMPYTRRYLDVLIRYWKRGGEDTAVSQLPCRDRKRGSGAFLGKSTSTGALLPETAAFRLTAEQAKSLDRAATQSGYSCISDLLRAFVGEGMRARGFSWT